MYACLDCGFVYDGIIRKKHWEMDATYIDSNSPHNVGIQYYRECPKCKHIHLLGVSILYTRNPNAMKWVTFQETVPEGRKRMGEAAHLIGEDNEMLKPLSDITSIYEKKDE